MKKKEIVRSQLLKTLDDLRDSIYTVLAPLKITAWSTSEPVPFSQRYEGEKLILSNGDKWGSLFDCAWFNFEGIVPESAKGKKVVLLIDVNGELCVVDKEGVPIRGLTNISSTSDPELGSPGKRVFQFLKSAAGGETVDIWADGACNDLFGEIQENGTVKEAVIAVCHDELRDLYYDFEVLLNLLSIVPENSARYQQVLISLTDVSIILQEFNISEAQEARKILAKMLAIESGDTSLTIYATGHAHLDLAWLWPIRETWRKAARTFATALELMDRYPNYQFGSSQPQLFQWMKEHYPVLYEKIKNKVRAGRIETHGAMWVEADTNITSGESLIRQILYGKRWFEKEFDISVNYMWLPDSFGYSAALPQIFEKSDVHYFMTQKLSWSIFNDFPYHSFHWQGVNGSSILVHMLPEETYNSDVLPYSIAKIENNYHEKSVSEQALLVYGIGDGGGGPGAEHLERLERLKNLAGLCPVKQEKVVNFFESWERSASRFPTWVGELYLEKHQGTFTTQTLTKRFNRQMEIALREWEWGATCANIFANESYPASQLETIWKEVLLYQFHDILPGSSIKRVYDECYARYKILKDEVRSCIQTTFQNIARQINTIKMSEPVTIFNSLAWQRQQWLKLKEKWCYISVPAMGYKVLDQANLPDEIPMISAKENYLENDLLAIKFNNDGTIRSVFDKAKEREIIEDGMKGNILRVFRDRGDAWDMPLDYQKNPSHQLQIVSAVPSIDGPRAILKQIYKFKQSVIEQQVILTSGNRRIDFVTSANWLEPETMLRTSFPISIHAGSATFDIQFGTIQRPTHSNTSWDLAKDEVPAHKWADLSQRDYGVALLNDCKYGYRIKKNIIDLNLIRSVSYPGPKRFEDSEDGVPNDNFTDQGEHKFSYALYPHQGDHVEGGVARAGYEFNIPLMIIETEQHAGNLPAEMSFVQVEASNIIIEAVKRAEDGRGFIFRFYENEGRECIAMINFNFHVQSAKETNLMEKEICSLNLKEGLKFKPFEIKSIRII